MQYSRKNCNCILWIMLHWNTVLNICMATCNRHVASSHIYSTRLFFVIVWVCLPCVWLVSFICISVFFWVMTSTLKMEAVCSSGTLITLSWLLVVITKRQQQESCRHEELKWHIFYFFCVVSAYSSPFLCVHDASIVIFCFECTSILLCSIEWCNDML
jgi:hypothetical protein